jgi:3-hydroxyethyl bacteriochlorophyllide a dehydrogenase
MLNSLAVVLEEPQRLALSTLPLDEPGAADVVVEVRWTGVSAGTEKLLFEGRMPSFPGMGYPLVPGYEAVGEVVSAGPESGLAVGAQVFVPGARCFGPVRGLHGGSASHLVAPGARVLPIAESFGESGILLALAATALHALKVADPRGPTLIVGHGALGRLIARAARMHGHSPVVWETNSLRASGARGYQVLAPSDDPRRDYQTIIDVSGDAQGLDKLIQRLTPGGCITLAGFYDAVRFAFPPAFMREASLRISAQWGAGDLAQARDLAQSGALPLDGLVTHRRAAREATDAYPTAFGDPACVKMVLDWSAT